MIITRIYNSFAILYYSKNNITILDVLTIMCIEN